MPKLRGTLANNCYKNIDNYSSKFVTMVHKLSTDLKKDFNYNGNIVFGYNEPGHKLQANITARVAAESWGNITQRFPGKKFASPSASPCKGGEDKCIADAPEWFVEFFDVCKQYSCQVDYIATHTYMCDADKVMKYLTKLHETHNKNILLTEFSCGQINSKLLMKIFMQQILPKLDASPFVIG